MSSSKSNPYELSAILFHCESECSYIFYILRTIADGDTKCIASFVYNTVEQALENLEIFVRRDSSSFMEGKNDLKRTNRFNHSENLYEVPGIQIGVVTGEEVIIYPGQLPPEDKEQWSKILMRNFSISVKRSSFNL